LFQLKKIFFTTTYAMKLISAVKTTAPTIFWPLVLGVEPGIPTIVTNPQHGLIVTKLEYYSAEPRNYK